MPAELRSRTQGHTLVLTLSNPDHRNALGPEIYAAGVEAFNVASDNRDIHAVVIHGEGDVFCAGGNLQRLQADRQQPSAVQAQNIESLHTWIEAVHTFPKPVIAAVEGAAINTGFALALACDLIVAASSAVFVMAYANIALSPDSGGSWILPHALPRQLASELLLCGERIGAERLYQLGIVNRICEAGQALDTALAWAESIGARAPNVLASIKELIHDAAGNSLSRHLAQERDHFVRNLYHANAGIGIDAFLAKRKPEYE
ncbi:MAG: enoyl-CoA hydratase [Burkholderiaceae bacterium]|jgi:enoyl-CoA hydratase/carnithine racemase|nr:enoyl-CoA hydratase [Burkholderiaceae bacterium]